VRAVSRLLLRCKVSQLPLLVLRYFLPLIIIFWVCEIIKYQSEI
jgi:hypothetical protein